MAQLTIVRKKEFINYFRNYRIVIDGKKAGSVGNGQTKVFDIPDGHHTIQAGIDWCASQTKDVKVDADDNVTLYVGGFTHNQHLFTKFVVVLIVDLILRYLIQFEYTRMVFLPFGLVIFYYMTFGRKQYLQLEEISFG